MRIFGILTIFLLIVCSELWAQPDSLWSRTFGTTGSENCREMIRTTDNGFALVGGILSPIGSRNFYLVKTDSLGNESFARSIGSSDPNYAQAIAQTGDGGFIMAGYNVTTTTDDDWLLLKTNANGDSMWSRTYGGMLEDQCNSVHQTSDGGYILAGYSRSFGDGTDDAWVMKTNSSGDSLWSWVFPQEYAGRFTTAGEVAGGGYFAVGWEFITAGSDFESFLVRMDTDGDTLWTLHCGTGSNTDHCLNAVQTSDGGFILAGEQWTTSNIHWDLLLQKISSIGEQVWARTYGSPSEQDYGFSVLETVDGGYVVGGYTASYGCGGDDMWLLRTDSQGDSLWSMTFGGPGTERCYAVVQTPDYGYALAGYSSTYGPGGDDMWLVKTGIDPVTQLPPGPFMRVIPADCSFVNWPLDTFSWTRSIDPNGDEVIYLFHVESNMPGYESFDASTTDTVLMFDRIQRSGNLDEVFTFHWTVRAAANNDTTEASNGAGLYFYDTPEPPGPFNRVLPTDGTTLTGSFIDFAWTRSIDPNGDEVTYLLSIHAPTYPLPDPYELTTADTALTVPIAWDEGNLDEIHNFYWRVYAISNFDTVEAANGEGLFFVETPSPPGDFARVMPQDDSQWIWSSVDPTIDFIWTRSVDPNGDPISYIFRIESPTYSGMVPDYAVFSDTIITVEFSLPVESLDDIHHLYWTVYATANFDTVEATNGEGHFTMDVPGAADEPNAIPSEYVLSVYPNPFNPSTTVAFDIPRQGHVSLIAYDLLGRVQARLADRVYNVGSYSFNWDCASCPAGIYLIELKADNYRSVTKAMLLR